MAKTYEEDQDRYEWLDLFPKKKRSNLKTVVMKRSSLVQQLQQISGNVHDVCKVTLLKDIKSQNLTDLILKEKKDGFCVVILKHTNGNRTHAVVIDVKKIV